MTALSIQLTSVYIAHTQIALGVHNLLHTVSLFGETVALN